MELSPATKFNVTILPWQGPVPFFEAYREIAETVCHALRRLGYEAVLTDGKYLEDRINIVFGFHIMDPARLPGLSRNTIFYHLEQTRPDGQVRRIFHEIQSQVIMWEYSRRNIPLLRKMGISRIIHVPVGYVPEMRRIGNQEKQDIDVLFYGLVDERRQKILDGLAARGLNVKVLQFIYGEERDRYIARSKVVLNMRREGMRIFEVARVSYLLANGKAVVSEYSDDVEIDDDLKESLVLAGYDELIPACARLVHDLEERRHQEKRGFSVMAARDECAIIQEALRRTSRIWDQ